MRHHLTTAADTLSVKQEQFAQQFVETGVEAEAYRSAYSTANMSANAVYVEACRLLQTPKVSLRVAELREKAAKRSEIAVDDVIAGLREIAESSTAPDSARVSAWMGISKVQGFIV